jgi:hypothetical protein
MKLYCLLDPDDEIKVGDELLPKSCFKGPWVPVVKDRDDKGHPIKCGDHIIRRKFVVSPGKFTRDLRKIQADYAGDNEGISGSFYGYLVAFLRLLGYKTAAKILEEQPPY